ncbi:MAG: metallophosphoesterase [Actinomycetota bacterium]|nr:metallophosphoesterase [Actinomycetota bacterium]
MVWRALPGPRVCFEIAGQSVTVSATPPGLLRRTGRRPVPLRTGPGAVGGPGSVLIDGLRPATRYELKVSGPGVGLRRVVDQITTLPTPPGPLLHRFATINDLHLGERGFGVGHTIEDVWPLPPGWRPYTWRCAKAAIDEALAWGAQTLIVKGDLTSDSAPADYHEVGELLSQVGVPVIATFGNHEYHDVVTEGRPILASYGINVPRQAWAQDLPGIRVVVGLTGQASRRSGRVDADQRSAIVSLAQDAPGPVFLALHHQPQRWRFPNQYPPGIPGPQAAALLDGLVAANPATFVATGHTHRHRRHHHGPLAVAEIGSTKDYPGTWAGYAVHQGGIRQVVRRTAVPDVLAWTETTSRALAGVWGRWSPGRTADRCFTHPWPN